MNILLISILEASYIIFIMNYFKTKYNFAHPLTYFQNDYLYHPVINVPEPQSMVCNFGKDVSWLLGLYFIIRGLLFKYYSIIINKINIAVLIVMFIGSLLNFNVTIYFLPIYVIEYVLFFS